MATTKYTAGLHLVVSTPTLSLDKDDRKAIRSHATRARVQRSQRKPGQLQSWIGSNQGLSKSALAKSISFLPYPKLIGSTFSGLQLPSGFEPCMIQDLVQMISINQHIGYPYEICLNVHPVDRGWFPYMISDVCCLHSLMFSLRAFLDKDSQSYLASYHYAQTLKILQARLDDYDRTNAISDATIMVVMTLSMVAEVMNDFAAMKTHVDGLAKIVNLRGGVRALDSFRNMQVKVCRADLAYALRSGDQPLFYKEELSWDCFIADSGMVKCSYKPHDTVIQQFARHALDIKLHNIFRDLHAFSCVSNIAYQTTRKLSPELYNEMIISIMYRLMHLSFTHDLLQETIRVGLLAFSSTIFMRRYFLEEPYQYLIEIYNKSLSELLASSTIIPIPIRLWLVIMPSVIMEKDLSTEDTRGVWLEEAIVLAGVDTWSQACEILRSVAWVGFVHDALGKRAFEAAMDRISSSDAQN